MNIIFNTLFVGLFFVMLTKSANAYIDPGTGSFLFQLIAGVFLGGLFTIKLYYKKIKLFFVKIFKKDRDEKSN